MKTHFTADDIGKKFATSQEGVTAKLVSYNGSYIPCLFLLSNESVPRWFFKDGRSWSAGEVVYLNQPLPSEADLLRKEMEELKSQLSTSDRHRAEDAWSALGEINSWRDKYMELKAKHEADLRTAVEMAREGYSSLYTPDEIIEKILKK
jgi:hypothetical protein